jgi:hypothetical protein
MKGLGPVPRGHGANRFSTTGPVIYQKTPGEHDEGHYRRVMNQNATRKNVQL